MHRIFHLLLIFLFHSFSLFAFDKGTVVIHHFDEDNNFIVDTLWRYTEVDKPENALPATDDSKWELVNSKLQGRIVKSVSWFRIRIALDSSLADKAPVAMKMIQNGASEIYLDGRKIWTLGNVSSTKENEIRWTANNDIVLLNLIPGKEHLLAVRYSNHFNTEGMEDQFRYFGFHAQLSPASFIVEETIASKYILHLFSFGLCFFLLALGFIHLLLFIFYRKIKSNFYYFLFVTTLAALPFLVILMQETNRPERSELYSTLIFADWPLILFSFMALLYSIFYEKFPKIFWVFSGFTALVILLMNFNFLTGGLLLFIMMLGVCIEAARVVIIAIRSGKKGAILVGSGAGFLILFTACLILAAMIMGNISATGTAGLIILAGTILSILGLPISMSIYLARDYAQTNNTLEKKLNEVRELSEKNIEQEKEKQKILENQNVMLEEQVHERTAEIMQQKQIIEAKNKDIIDSITYAKHIQDAILPNEKTRKHLFPDSFVLYLPKDIVAGDFYWIEETEDHIFIAAADCTGHGVPGAMVSVVCSNALTKAVLEDKIHETAAILDKARSIVIEKLSKSEDNIRDGMDICLVRFSKKNRNDIQYSGANRPLWYIQNNELHEIKPDKQSIGYHEEMKPFTSSHLHLNSGNVLYMFTDGFADQFGGDEGKKFKTARLKEMLISISEVEMEDQKNQFRSTFEDWKGALEQVDDITIIGIRI
ncbi:MAG: hypothetical protein Fur0041_19890 [Bacteroidia bacterium]